MRVWIGCVLALGFIAGTSSRGAAQDVTFTVKETLQEKVICDPACTEIQSGKFQSKMQTTVAPETVANFDENTTFTVSLGSFTVSHILNHDTQYVPGATSARFRQHHTDTHGISYWLDIRLSWKAGKIKLLVKADTPAFGSPIAWQFVGSAVGPISSTAPMRFTLLDPGDLDLTVALTPALVEGKLTRTSKNVNGSDYELDKITVSAGTN